MRKKAAIILAAVVVLLGWVLSISPKRNTLSPDGPTVAGRSNTTDLDILSTAIGDPRFRFEPKRNVAEADNSQQQAKTNLLLKLIQGEDIPKLTPAQAEPYLDANRRSSESLLAARQATGDLRYLLEAMEKYPNDPKVAYIAAYKAETTPAEKKQWLTAFEQADPNNALANYLSASALIKVGQPDAALQEMAAAAGKSSLDDYGRLMVQNTEEAYLVAGYSQVDAKTAASAGLLLPQLADLKALAQGLNGLATTYRQSGDEASARAALDMALGMGERVGGHDEQPLITTLVGIAIERIALNSMQPTDQLGGGETVADRLKGLQQERQGFKEMTQQFNEIMNGLPEQEMVAYLDRVKVFGEASAMKWMVGKFGKH